MRRELGVNTWVWASPLTDVVLAGLAAKASEIGYQAIELPVENPGDWDPGRAAETLDRHGLQPYVVGAMGPGRDLARASAKDIQATQQYLIHCVSVASRLGARIVAGPFYAATGRVWRMTPGERRQTVGDLRRNLAPVVDAAAKSGVTIAIEPLNRYETSLINTVEQAMDALDPLLGEGLGLAIDSYHLNIEEKSIPAAIRTAGDVLAHVQVCGNDRGAVGDDHIDWPRFLDALDDVGYTGPLNLESFTGANETIATAASIWRPLASSQDALAERSFRYLTRLQDEREQS